MLFLAVKLWSFALLAMEIREVGALDVCLRHYRRYKENSGTVTSFYCLHGCCGGDFDRYCCEVMSTAEAAGVAVGLVLALGVLLGGLVVLARYRSIHCPLTFCQEIVDIVVHTSKDGDADESGKTSKTPSRPRAPPRQSRVGGLSVPAFIGRPPTLAPRSTVRSAIDFYNSKASPEARPPPYTPGSPTPLKEVDGGSGVKRDARCKGDVEELDDAKKKKKKRREVAEKKAAKSIPGEKGRRDGKVGGGAEVDTKRKMSDESDENADGGAKAVARPQKTKKVKRCGSKATKKIPTNDSTTMLIVDDDKLCNPISKSKRDRGNAPRGQMRSQLKGKVVEKIAVNFNLGGTSSDESTVRRCPTPLDNNKSKYSTYVLPKKREKKRNVSPVAVSRISSSADDSFSSSSLSSYTTTTVSSCDTTASERSSRKKLKDKYCTYTLAKRAKVPKQPKEPKAPKQLKQSKEAKQLKQHKEAKQPKQPKEVKQPRQPKEVKQPRQAKRPKKMAMAELAVVSDSKKASAAAAAAASSASSSQLKRQESRLSDTIRRVREAARRKSSFLSPPSFRGLAPRRPVKRSTLGRKTRMVPARLVNPIRKLFSKPSFTQA